jgi:hypothetical protein
MSKDTRVLVAPHIVAQHSEKLLIIWLTRHSGAPEIGKLHTRSATCSRFLSRHNAVAPQLETHFRASCHMLNQNVNTDLLIN